jgi:hypothetical protein
VKKAKKMASGSGEPVELKNHPEKRYSYPYFPPDKEQEIQRKIEADKHVVPVIKTGEKLHPSGIVIKATFFQLRNKPLKSSDRQVEDKSLFKPHIWEMREHDKQPTIFKDLKRSLEAHFNFLRLPWVVPDYDRDSLPGPYLNHT